jgi:hypothetical protein
MAGCSQETGRRPPVGSVGSFSASLRHARAPVSRDVLQPHLRVHDHPCVAQRAPHKGSSEEEDNRRAVRMGLEDCAATREHHRRCGNVTQAGYSMLPKRRRRRSFVLVCDAVACAVWDSVAWGVCECDAAGVRECDAAGVCECDAAGVCDSVAWGVCECDSGARVRVCESECVRVRVRECVDVPV